MPPTCCCCCWSMEQPPPWPSVFATPAASASLPTAAAPCHGAPDIVLAAVVDAEQTLPTSPATSGFTSPPTQASADDAAAWLPEATRGLPSDSLAARRGKVWKVGPLGGGSPMAGCEAGRGTPAAGIPLGGTNPKAESGRCAPAAPLPLGAPLLDPACCWEECPATWKCSPAAAGVPAACVVLLAECWLEVDG